MKYEAIRKTVLEAILEAVEKGLINGTSGNIAMRDSEDRNIVAITPSGISCNRKRTWYRQSISGRITWHGSR